MKEENPIHHFFSSHFGSQLNSAQKELIYSSYRKENHKKRTVIFSAGDMNTRHYIIKKGLLRLYLIDAKGKEINILFAKENQVIGDLATPIATNFYLETIENSEVYSIEDSGLQKILGQLDLGRTMDSTNGLRRSYIHIQKRLVSILSKPAEENYLEFKENHPDLIQRIPQYLIAGYLGISPEFLSKIIAKASRAKL